MNDWQQPYKLTDYLTPLAELSVLACVPSSVAAALADIPSAMSAVQMPSLLDQLREVSPVLAEAFVAGQRQLIADMQAAAGVFDFIEEENSCGN